MYHTSAPSSYQIRKIHNRPFFSTFTTLGRPVCTPSLEGPFPNVATSKNMPISTLRCAPVRSCPLPLSSPVVQSGSHLVSVGRLGWPPTISLRLFTDRQPDEFGQMRIVSQNICWCCYLGLNCPLCSLIGLPRLPPRHRTKFPGVFVVFPSLVRITVRPKKSWLVLA